MTPSTTVVGLVVVLFVAALGLMGLYYVVAERRRTVRERRYARHVARLRASEHSHVRVVDGTGF